MNLFKTRKCAILKLKQMKILLYFNIALLLKKFTPLVKDINKCMYREC